jgi:microcystin-dependent protein
MDPYVGQLSLVGFDFAPRGYALAQGQIMSITQNTALFSLLGTYYGGDGRTTFGLPNLQGSVPVGMGASPGLNQYVLGETGGTQTVSLLTSQAPAHTHTLRSAGGRSTQSTPGGHALGNAPGSVYSNAAPNSPMNASAVSMYGNGASHNNLMPYQSLNWIIALTGIFPPRN